MHLIDREGDSAGHIRRWEAAGSHWLVRVKDNPKVDHAGNPMACKAVAQALAFLKTRQVSYQGKTYWQWMAEAEVTLDPPCQTQPEEKQKTCCPRNPCGGKSGGQPCPIRSR